MRMSKCPETNLLLPTKLIDEKQSLKKSIDEWVDKVVLENQHIEGTYFLTFHAKFDKFDPSVFTINRPKLSYKLPPFVTNTMVFWINNKKGVCELLWIVPSKKKGKKPQPEFNKSGVAYLQAKGAMPS